MVGTIPKAPRAGTLFDRRILALLGASLVARLLLSALVGPGFDEAYYSLYARNLSWGYFDHPPLVALTAGFGGWITGVQTPFTLRLGSVLLFTVTLVGTYLLAATLYGRRAGWWSVMLMHATPFFTAGAGAFVIPDNALLAAWVWALYMALLIRRGAVQRTLGFLALGMLLGLALLAKYHAVLLAASLVVASFYDRPFRRWWSGWRLYLSLLVAVLVFLPCLLWNAENGWISFAEQFGKGASGELRLRFDLLGQALGGQLGYLTPWVGIALWIAALKKRREVRADDRWLVAFFLVPVVGMSLIGLTRGILPHWTMPGYAAAFVLAGGAFRWGRGASRRGAVAVAVNGLLLLLVVLQARFGVLPLPAKADPTLDPVGWRGAIAELRERDELRPGDVLFAHKWFTAGEIAWADGGQHPVVLIGPDPHMFAWWAPEPAYPETGGVLITQKRYNLDADHWLEPRFEHVEEIDLGRINEGWRSIEMRAWRVENLRHPRVPMYGPYARTGPNEP